MKVALIIKKLNIKGGTQRLLVELAKGLKMKGHFVKIYTFEYEPDETYTADLAGVQVISLGRSRPRLFPLIVSRFRYLDFIAGWLSEARSSRKLARLIDNDTDLLNPHGDSCHRVSAFFKSRKRLAPSVWMMSEMFTKSAALRRSGEFGGSEAPLSKLVLAKMADWFDYRFFIRSQDAIVVHDQRDFQSSASEFGIPTYILPAGIEAKFFQEVLRRPVARHDLTLLSSGIFFPHRRYEDILEALALLRRKGVDAKLRIVGSVTADPAYFKKIQTITEQLGLKNRVVFLGTVSEEDLLAEYRNADIFVFASHLQSWGMAVFEAMAAGLPAVVSETAGASEVLTDGENALIVPPKNPEALAATIGKLAAHPDFYEKISVAGKRFTEANISWEKFSDGMEKVFESALGGRGNGGVKPIMKR